MGRGYTKKVRVKWTHLQDPNEFEYGFNHRIFKDPSAPLRRKAQKIVHQMHIAPLEGGVSAAGSNESDVLELHPSSPEVSGAENEADGSAGIVSLNVGGNDWRADDALNSVDPRGPMAEAVRNPIFRII
jgi:hypothetical protein